MAHQTTLHVVHNIQHHINLIQLTYDLHNRTLHNLTPEVIGQVKELAANLQAALSKIGPA